MYTGFLLGDPEGKRPLGRPMHRWNDNTKIHLQGVGWIDVAQDRGQVPGTCECGNESFGIRTMR